MSLFPFPSMYLTFFYQAPGCEGVELLPPTFSFTPDVWLISGSALKPHGWGSLHSVYPVKPFRHSFIHRSEILLFNILMFRARLRKSWWNFYTFFPTARTANWAKAKICNRALLNHSNLATAIKLEVVYRLLTCHAFWKWVLVTVHCVSLIGIYQKCHWVQRGRKGKIIGFTRKKK